MSNPAWNEAQAADADRTLAAVEADLEAALFGARITPVRRTEAARITRDGRVDTSLPVSTILSFDGAAPPAELPADELPRWAPPGYEKRDGYLWQLAPGGAAAALAVGWPWIPGEPVYALPPYSDLVVPITYLGGWGSQPALVDAIIAKARDRLTGVHADVVRTAGLAARDAVPAKPYHFTADELAALSRFRNLGWAG